MSIICTRCGGTQVVCEATVNPNTKVITEISDDSLQFGRCETCKARSVLTDVEKTKAAIKSGFAGFVEANGRKPHYASCRIVWKYTNDSEDVKIRLLESGESIGNDMFIINFQLRKPGWKLLSFFIALVAVALAKIYFF